MLTFPATKGCERTSRFFTKSEAPLKILSSGSSLFWTMTEIRQNSRLLNLPGELRTQIYGTVLVHGDVVDFNWHYPDRRRKKERHDRPEQWLALIYTCRQIYTEAIGIVYSEHAFDFSATTSEKQLFKIQWFLDTIGPVNASFITRVLMHAPDLRAIVDSENEEEPGPEREEDGVGNNSHGANDNGHNQGNDDESVYDSDFEPEFFFQEEGEDEKPVEISQVGLDCMRTLRDRCPGLSSLRLYFFPPRRSFPRSSTAANQARYVAGDRVAAAARIVTELREFPCISHLEIAEWIVTEEGHFDWQLLKMTRDGP